METITQKPIAKVVNSHESIVLPPGYLDELTKLVVKNLKQKYVLYRKRKKENESAENPLSEAEKLHFIKNVASHVCGYFEITPEQLYSDTRGAIHGNFFTLSEMRFMAMKMSRELPKYPIEYKFIGRHLGGRDHSSVQHGINKITGLIEVSENFRKAYSEIKALVEFSISPE